ncbi:PIG-L family deacetylase [Mucilaginibacter sp. RS28]|uniref:PIG-L family deacetylase n=1 Tax=Mucilaginibacter straminoryzae TaxID=2932774 RepID=A0A9X1X916_9SPHI|nr:PIG-L family deacetylase [Mucilaginibacter straminoryzae]MCJ8211963.1 PIG-L family deacetylase [Mucilaginibacter straminoryzae]
MKRTIFFIIIWLSLGKVVAQTAMVSNTESIEQSLRKLNVLGSVLYVAAHPDDENTRLLAYLAQEKHYRTGYLSLTRGDGGQNLIGTEQGEWLGAIRTQELLAARRVDGAEQFFTRANDFGFSKGPEETLKIWDREKILADVVWVIRNFRPDVMICRFPTTGEGGHGHHTSSAILAQEAFTAAADPNRFPEQLKYVKPWQAKRLLWNTFNFGSANTINPDQFKIDVGGYNPFLGKNYGEIAAESRSNHKTQGFGSARQRGQAFEYFKTILGEAPQTDLMDGINTTWKRVPGGNEIEANLMVIRKNFDAAAPQRSVPSLVNLLGMVEKLNDQYWKQQKSQEIKNLIAACAGLWFESYSAAPVYAIGDNVEVSTQIIVRSDVPVGLNGISFQGEPVKDRSTQNIAPNIIKTVNAGFIAEKTTQPYWLKYPHGVAQYKTEYLDSTGFVEQKTLPQNIAPYMTAIFNIAGRSIRYDIPVQYKYVDPARGEIYQPLVIAPPVTANVASKDYIFSTQKPQTVQVKLKAFTDAAGAVAIKQLPGWKISPERIPFEGKKKGDEWTVTFTVTPADANPRTSTLQVVTTVGDKSYTDGFHQIRYEHIPTITLFPEAQAKLVNIDLKTAGKQIGYITGAGDLVPEALQQVGYDVHELTEAEVMSGDLSRYDAIVIGVRAYNVSQRLVYEQPRLLDYVKNGGNLVVQYNNNAGILVNPIGPYPFTVVNQRVTNENAPVTVTEPADALLNYPNKITPKDFEGWVQERGLYFVSNIDNNYHAPLTMNDPGEAPNKGSLIEASYGKGRFVYTSLSFFRQLPAGVPGAYRLFINLLSNPKK